MPLGPFLLELGQNKKLMELIIPEPKKPFDMPLRKGLFTSGIRTTCSFTKPRR